ncbi:helix-turn-helix domain-containing protein [uncultured Aquimarina sp.]|uniref:helix-turn-helix domain-containing protein n=1 Tax=uncultured Aquimarina sp. TaxID=575652 RepID=UPI0026235E59|nr:helix-turn-helix domain-containing protein [uncultured Aquimarina sp.]
MNLDLWSILILIVIFQGFFFLTVLLVSPSRKSKKENVYLFSIILLLIWFLGEFLAIRNTYNVGFSVFYGTRYGSWFLLGPLTFFYFKTITDSEWKFAIKHVLHFIPFVVFCLVIPVASNESLSIRQITYGMLAVFDHRKKIVTPFEYLYSVVFFVQFVHFGCYLIYNIKTTNTYAKNLKSEYSDLGNVIWLKLFNILLISILVLASSYLYILFVSDFYRRYLDYIYVLPMGFFIYSIGYYLSGIQWLSIGEKAKKYHSSTLSIHEIKIYSERLKVVMSTDEPYLKNDLRLKDLARIVDVSSHSMSQIINQSFKCSFFDFINQYRVEEAKRLIISEPKITLLQVAFDAGFNNKTSFVNAFKKFEKKTPSSFRKEIA